MKLEKAIEILTLMGKPDFQAHTEDILAARKLGIEALSFIIRLRSCSLQARQTHLPGETLFIDTTRSEHSIKKILESPLGKEPKPIFHGQAV
ncbi:unnamed protein product, partial [marine sediment metagenome]